MKRLACVVAFAAALSILALFPGCSSTNASSSSSGSSSTSISAESSDSSRTAVDPSNLTDGEYTVEVSLAGGIDGASIESPAKFIVTNGEKRAVIVWSNDKFDQMIVGGEEYLPVPRAGNSTFEIPFDVFDKGISVSAHTTDMSEGESIDCTLTFDSKTIEK